MRRDALVACADDGMLPVDPADRRAAAARMALVARLVGVVEVGATRALQEIAGGGRPVAQLSRRAGEQGARQHRVVAPHATVGGEVGIAHERADAQTAVVRLLDPVEIQTIDVEQMRRRFDFELHEVEQVGTAGDELRAGRACGRCRGLGGRFHSLIAEGFHARPPATSLIASMMLE
jgi:hypothetical protein